MTPRSPRSTMLSRHPAIICFAGMMLAGIAHRAVAASEANISLQAHEQRPWTLPDNLERVAIADPAVADLVMLRGKHQALLVGKQPGRTTLLLWLHSDSTPERIQVDVRNAVQQGLLDGSNKDIALTLQDGQALLEGSTPSLIEHEQAREGAAAAVGDKGTVSDSTTIASGGVVQVEVKVVEFDKTVISQLGLNFKNANGGFSYGITSPLNSTGTTGTGTSTTSGGLSSAFSLVAQSVSHNWSASLNILQSNGLARVLAEPTLVALSGQSASFLAGGELPIPEPQGLGTTTIIYKPFGIGLTVTPTVLAADRIALKVAPEASDLDYSNAITINGTQVPAITVRRADTTVELGDGESFVIGGLVSRTTTSTVDKVPLLGDLPIIGAFFRDLNYKRQDQELVIVVTPHLVQPLARGVEVPLPGQSEEHHQPIWSSWLLHPAGSDQLPGFSR